MAADDYHPISKHGKTTAASAVSPSSIKKPKERVPAKPDMPEINCYLMCQLCSGYLIDATAIIECQHTFCKSCILKYLETNSYCPICDVQLNKAKPHLSLRSDVIIQRLVYKLVPGLLVSEIRRRRDFSIKNGMDPVEAAELASNSIATEIEASSDLSTVLSLDDVVSLSVEYFRSDDSSTVPGNKAADANGKQSQQPVSASQNQQTQQHQQQKSNVKSNSVSSSSGDTTTSSANTNISDISSDNSDQANDRRYLQCPAAVSVGLLKKFIRMKYGLSDDYRVDLLYNGDRDSILENDLTLLDVAFIFKWNKDEPMKFHYRIFERPAKSISVYSGMKRPAPPVMDEPPDDDTASGPHNRSSMFSSSSAPSSKLPRLTDSTSTSGNQGSVPNNNTSGKSTTTSTTTPTTAASASTSAPTASQSAAKSSNSSVTPTPLKVEKEEVEEDEDDDDDDEEDYELVERKSHMKGIKSSRRHSNKESMKRSVVSNLRSQLSRSHSTDSKSNTTESSERESRNENSLSSKRDSGVHKSSGKKKGNSNDGKEQKDARGRLSSSSSTKGLEQQPQTTGSLKLSISTSGVTPVVSSSIVGEKKEPLKLSLGSVLAKGNKSPERKHHKHKHHHHKLRHRDKQSKGVASVVSQKPLKLSFTLSPPSGTTITSQTNSQSQGNQSQNKSGSVKQASSTSSQDSGIEVKEPGAAKGKPIVGMQNYNNSARTSSSAHGHLNNISKSISVSVNTNANNMNNSSSSNNSMMNKGDQYGNKVLSPAELIPKNTGMEIQPTTIPISSSHGQISQHPQQHQSNVSSSGSSNNNSHKHSHPLLPDSVHVPKSVTLIPVNPNSMSLSNSSAGKGNSSQEKGGSGSQGNQNRINAHTFTHPITNKSLHQITVTEVPPPPKPSGSSPSMMGNSISNNTHSSISGSTSNPIEKVIANAANNKPQFNGPGSMEITKIYCGTTKENPAKKLKDRKGLDISITGTGINVSVNKSSQKLEETLRQKVNIAIGGGNGSISVTPAPNNSSLNSSGNNAGAGNNNINSSSGGGQMNKMKSISTAASLLSGKMPPGITIGPATAPTSSGISSSNNAAATSNSNALSGVGNMGNNNIVKGLGFTLPPHLTAHPHIPNNMKNANNKIKSDKSCSNTINTNNSRLLNKDSISIIGKGNGNGGHQPPPVEITISAAGGNKSHANITSRGINIMNKSKINDPLASIFDITQGIRKSPSPTNNTKDTNKTAVTSIPISMPSNVMPSSNSVNTTVSSSSSSGSNNNKNMVNKRPYDLIAATQGSNNNKKVKESPEMKRGRSASTSSEPGKVNNSSSGKGRDAEIPLDLSGRSTRTTPPITIPHRESSKSPSVSSNASSDKRVPISKSPETDNKVGIPIAPSSTTSNNFISTKINQKQHAKESFKGQSQSVSVSKSSPNQVSKIGSIVDSLAQKQAQQQQLQIQKNSQNHQQQQSQQQQQLHHQHRHHSSTPNSNSSALITSPNNSSSISINAHSGIGGNNNVSSVKASGGSSGTGSSVPSIKVSPSNTNNSSMSKGPAMPNSSGLGSPITGSSLGSPAIPMTSPSPPGDHLRNLWTLSDTAARQGKINSMNELLAAASLFSPPGHPHPALGGPHQLAGSPSGAAGAFNPNMFAQFQHHLATLGANKIPPGMFDPHIMAAALNAHNAHAAGLRMHHFVGSMSPPLNIPNAFYPHGAATNQQQQPSPVSPAAAGGLKIPSVNPKQPASNTNVGAKSNPIPFAPLFSHSVPVSSPKSPTSSVLPSPGTAKSPTGSIGTTTSIPPVLPFTTSASSMVNNALSNHTNSNSSASEQQKHSFSSTNKSASLHHDSSSAPTHTSNSSKITKINGTMSTTALPVFPPGIHNPLLASRSSSSNSSSSSSASNMQTNSSSTAGKSFSPFAPNKMMMINTAKGGIPNSMKISNFLPSKPKDSSSDANAEATITSGSNYHIPNSQAKPNFSLSPTRSISNSSLNSAPSLNIPKSPSIKESPISPVKAAPTIIATAIPNPNPHKPSSMTCASLLRPDTTYSKASTHPMLNSLSPTKGDQGNLGLCSSRSRTPSSESPLSPGSLGIKAISPGAVVSFNKSPNSGKDVFRSEEIKSLKTNSPPKDEITCKKQIGIIPMGPSDVGQGKNFATAMRLLSPQHQQSLSLNRPIPTVPGFLNTTTNSLPLSSTVNVSHSPTKESLSLPSSSAKPLSPVKLASPIKTTKEPHLPSPVFPFPGVSVPFQVVKLQDDETESVPAATVPAVTSTPAIINTIPFKQEVKQVESKSLTVEAEIKSPNSTLTGQTLNVEKMTAKPFLNLETEARKIKADMVTAAAAAENACEIPAKVQKIEMEVSAIKNESVEAPTVVSENKDSSSSSSESNIIQTQAGNKNGATTSESEAQREPTVAKAEGEQKNANESKGDVADLPQQLCSSPSKSPLKSEAQTFSPVKAEVVDMTEAVTEKTLSAPAQSPPPPSVQVTAVLEEMQTKPVEAEVESNAEKVEDDEEEKSVSQITVDIPSPKSDETSMQVKHQESESLEIPQEKEIGQIIRENDERENTDDIEMEPVEPLPAVLLGQKEQQEQTKIVISMEMDNDDDNQMEIDVEESDDKMEAEEEKKDEEKIEIEETKEEEDDVDVVDVGVDEPMEINADGIIHSLENDGEASEKLSEVERASIDSITNEQALFPLAMEVVDDESDGDSKQYEIIEYQPENVDASRDDNVDVIEKNGEELYVHKDFVEESEDVIKRQKLEMNEENDDDENADVQQSNDDVKDVMHEPSDLVDKHESESGNILAESSLYPENEASNLSQDDSECGNLIIDLDPTEEQLQNDENDENEGVEELSQEEIPEPASPPKTESESTIVLEIKENENETSEECVIESEEESVSVPPQETAEVDDHESFPVLLNTEMTSEPENEQLQNQQSLVEEDEKQALSPADDDNTLMESVEPQVAGGEPLNQDSIPNQITINPPPIEVNGVIKTDEESEKREDDMPIPEVVPEVVAECPHVEEINTVASADEKNDEKGEEEEVATSEELFIPAPAVVSVNESEHSVIDALENNNASELNDVTVSDSQLDTEDAFSLTTEDNKNTADDDGEVVEGDKKIEEEQQQQLEEQHPEISINEPLAASETSAACLTDASGEEAVVENDAEVSPLEIENVSVHFPDNDNNVPDSQNISVADDSLHCSPATETFSQQQNIEQNETTPMEIEESNDIDFSVVQQSVAVEENETVPEINAEAPQTTEFDNVASTVDSSDSCLLSEVKADEIPTMMEEEEESLNIDDVAVISATATITTAPAVATEAVTLQEDDNALTTPTTSTSSVAIKLDISANDDGNSNDAESLLPPSSSLIPSGINTSHSSSSSSSSSSTTSPVEVPTTGLIGSKSLETFGKVAAGLLASATSTINNNNNNTSLAPTTCEAMSIATTNANA